MIFFFFIGVTVLLRVYFLFAGQKYECARKWNVYCVSLHWLFDSIEKGYSQDESRYMVQRKSSTTTQPNTSTPTGTSKREGTLPISSVFVDAFMNKHKSTVAY